MKVLAQWVASCWAICLGSVANPSSAMSSAPMEQQLPGVSFLRCVSMFFFAIGDSVIMRLFLGLLHGGVKFVGKMFFGNRDRVVLKAVKPLCVAGVRIGGVDVCADVWVLKVFAIHLWKVEILCGPYEAKGAVEFVVVVSGLCEDVVLSHAVGNLMHGPFG